MRPRFGAGVMAAGLVVSTAWVAAQEAKRAEPVKAGEVPPKKVVTLPPRGTYVPAKTPWGDPDITGDCDNSDESGIPFETQAPFEYACHEGSHGLRNILAAARADEAAARVAR